MLQDSLKKSEFLTRKRLIDDRLKRAGWNVVRCKEEQSPSECVAEVASRYGFAR
jgi:type I site-specific restriction endonuclease